MGKFDEFAQAEEDMKDIGDTPPVITQEGVPLEQPQEESGQFQVQDGGTSGGLGERTVEGEDAPFSIEDVLGIGKPSEPVETEQEQAGEKPAESEEQPTGTEARFSEMSEQLRNEREQTRLLTEKLLQLNTPSGEPEASHVIDLDDDVKEYMKPYIEAELGSRMAAMEESLAPMKKASEDEALAGQISIHVEGFTAKDLPKQQAAFNAIPDAQKGLYEGSVAGATLLAQKLANEGSFGRSGKKRTSNSLAARHQSESGSGLSGNQSGDMSEADKIRRLDNMSDDDITAILARMQS